MLHYEHKFGDYALVDDRGNVQFFSHSIAIGYDPENYVLHKHGRPESVHKWAADAKSRSKGLFDFAVIESDRWDLEDLNRLLSTSGYLEVFLKRPTTKQLPGH